WTEPRRSRTERNLRGDAAVFRRRLEPARRPADGFERGRGRGVGLRRTQAERWLAGWPPSALQPPRRGAGGATVIPADESTRPRPRPEGPSAPCSRRQAPGWPWGSARVLRARNGAACGPRAAPWHTTATRDPGPHRESERFRDAGSSRAHGSRGGCWTP